MIQTVKGFQLMVANANLIRGKLRVAFMRNWHSVLDDALECLPALRNCTQETFREIVDPRGSQEKCIAFVEKNDYPVGVIPLRRIGRLFWSPTLNYIIPGATFPVQPDLYIDALLALNKSVSIGLWRHNQEFGRRARVRNVRRTLTYGIEFSEDFESHWKTTSLWRNIKTTRNRCRDLEIQVDPGGASEWIIDRWATKWRVSSSEAQDRKIAALLMEKEGNHISFIVTDRRRWLAGATTLVDKSELVCQCMHREDGLDYYNLGNYIIDKQFHWAKQHGYKGIDLGGGANYKSRFAPVRGERIDFEVCPTYPVYYAGRTAKAVYHLLQKAAFSLR